MKKVHRRIVLAAASCAIVLGAAVPYVFGVYLPQRQVQALRIEQERLRARAPLRYAIAPGMIEPLERRSVVPTRGEMFRLQRMHYGWYVHHAPLPPTLTAAIMAHADLRARLASLARGDHVDLRTAADGNQADELVGLMTGRAFALEGTDCLVASLDAIRVAQATDTLPRYDVDISHNDESGVLAALEDRIVACGRAAPPDARRRAADALVRLEREHVPMSFPFRSYVQEGPYCIHTLEERRHWIWFPGFDAEFRDELHRCALHVDLLTRVLERRAPRADQRALASEYGLADRSGWARLELRLLAAALRSLNDAPIDDLRNPRDGRPIVVRSGVVRARGPYHDPALRDVLHFDGSVRLE